jgi:hypothetical protein
MPGDRYRLAIGMKWLGVRVPAGYVTNGADIPRPLWSIWPPNRSDWMPAVVIHDYLCERGEYERADRLLYVGLRRLGMPVWQARLWYAAVRGWHIAKKLTKKETK